MIKIIKPDFQFIDERGKLTQLVHEGFRQFNVVESKLGAVRGGHYHKQNDEAFYIIDGGVELSLKNNGMEEVYKFSKGDMFLILASVTHSFRYIADTVLISMYSKGVENQDGTKDIFEA